MIEILKNPKVDWLGAKKYFVTISILLLLLGAVSVQWRGFNLGIDFAGGTLMTVRFSEPKNPEQIRSVLSSVDIDTNKVIIQPIVNRPNELMIRTPRVEGVSEADQRIDADQRRITRALQRLNPAGDVAAGKVNINTITAEGIEQEIRDVDPVRDANGKGINDQTYQGAHPYRQIADQLVSFRDGQRKGFLASINEIQGLTFNVTPQGIDTEAIKRTILDRFYTGKIDLNLAGSKEIEDAFLRIDPLGIGSQSNAGETYRKAAEAIKSYRANRSGVINSLEEIQVQDVSADMLSKMAPYFTAGQWAVISADVVGPQVGDELSSRAIWVTLAALAGMLVYIAFRFEWIYGVAAVTAVFHDVLVTLGLFSLFRWEISLTVVAALLTLIGYSMNDTIVIFDRIRENLRFRRRDSLVQITNDSINETLSRTIITSGLTFISVVSIVLFGGEVLRGFAWALTIGILVGSYSTMAIASPIMLWWQYLMAGRREQQAARARRLAKV